MYLITLNKIERTHLLNVLSRNSSLMSASIAGRVRSAEDVFGVVSWSNDDIISLLEERGADTSKVNVRQVRNSYHARHIDDEMVDCGWSVLEDAVSELNS